MGRIRRGYKQTEIGEIPEDWEVVRLGDIGESIIGLTYSPENIVEGGLLVLRSSNIGDSGLQFDDNVFVNINVPNRLILRQGDILICVRNGSRNLIGKCAFIDERAEGMTFGAFMAVYRTKFGQFIFHQFQSQIIKKQISENIGATINQITNANLNSFLIPLPPLDEQRRIAEALSDADAQIMALAELIAKKRDIKHGTMQRLLTGQERLAGFSGEWEVVRLGNKDVTLKFVNGGTPSTQIKDYWNGSIAWITGGDIVDQKISSIRWYISEDAVKNSATNVIKKGNLLIVTRTGVGKLAIAPFDIAISQDLTGVYLNQQRVSVEFLFRYLDLMSKYIRNLNQGTSIEGITRETLANIEILLPPFDEQIAIARVLSDMDAEIEALQTEHDKLVMIKQGMMHELLTGKVRL